MLSPVVRGASYDDLLRIAKAAGADVSWMTLGTDALGLMPGIGMFGKGIKVAGKTAVAAEEAASATTKLLGTGFKATSLGRSRILFSMGKASDGLVGGLGKAGLVKIGGMSDHVFEVSHATSGMASRMGGLVNAGYREGQWLGSKGINTFTKFHVDPISGLGRAIDGSMKLAPKIGTSIAQAVSGD